MTNEELHEHYGWKAHNEGFFDEWRDRVTEKMKQHPNDERSRISYEIYKDLKNKKDSNEKK